MKIFTILLALLVAGISSAELPIEGFGAVTTGGSGGAIYTVTSLDDSGPGTLRDALSQSNRYIEFAVGGTIDLASTIRVTKDHITIDGTTALNPGITITTTQGVADLLQMRYVSCHDIIVQNIRIVGAGNDNLQIAFGPYNIALDQCSFRNAVDGNVDIAEDCYNITLQWCILGDTVKNSLIRTRVSNISIHHNLYFNGSERNPQLDDATVVDMVNNVIYNWHSNYGTRVRNGATANLIKNYYLAGPSSDVSDAIVVYDNGAVYCEDNIIPPESECPGTITKLVVPAVTEYDTSGLIPVVVLGAGCQPHDATDTSYAEQLLDTGINIDMTWSMIKYMYK